MKKERVELKDDGPLEILPRGYTSESWEKLQQQRAAAKAGIKGCLFLFGAFTMLVVLLAWYVRVA